MFKYLHFTRQDLVRDLSIVERTALTAYLWNFCLLIFSWGLVFGTIYDSKMSNTNLASWFAASTLFIVISHFIGVKIALRVGLVRRELRDAIATTRCLHKLLLLGVGYSISVILFFVICALIDVGNGPQWPIKVFGLLLMPGVLLLAHGMLSAYAE